MFEIIKIAVPPIITGLLAYFGAIYNSKVKIKEIKEIADQEIRKIKEQYDKQIEMNEKEAQTNLMVNVFQDLTKNNKQFNTLLMKELNKELNKANILY